MSMVLERDVLSFGVEDVCCMVRERGEEITMEDASEFLSLECVKTVMAKTLRKEVEDWLVRRKNWRLAAHLR